jgi:hypothetical protein
LGLPRNGVKLKHSENLAQAERKLGNRLETKAAEAAQAKSSAGNGGWLRMDRL